ncbi:juvenile hormone acid O-methyltransferase-like [Photinus pyralis]|uniref:juvenile hormone acid O-methyltransferase-like n=1 Tax=Photinus pyralis TaxID=7054 RepID=UPI0012676A03|nr:juvenile hormone acid O-methyltransferase-like isoform X2 [Photinus pyralis]XP_031348222.1 juvenile hormone acid O-methyltransferase-like [Photinus pyralis]
MYKAQTFRTHSLLAQRDARDAIEKIKQTMAWRPHCNVLDIGCGTGNVTHDVLLPILPESRNTIIGVDILTEFVQYANEKYGDKIVFEQMDIANCQIHGTDYEEHFDHIFSFYCLHFVGEQELALRNIYRLLKPSGDFFFTCFVKCNLFEAIRFLAGTEKWKPSMSEYHKYLCPYQFSSDPIIDLERMLLKIGFKVLQLSIEPKDIMLPTESASAFMFSHSPIELPLDFPSACLDVLREWNDVHTKEDNKEYCCLKYHMIFGYVAKL